MSPNRCGRAPAVKTLLPALGLILLAGCTSLAGTARPAAAPSSAVAVPTTSTTAPAAPISTVVPSTTTPTSPPAAPHAAGGGRWVPRPGTSWQWQLSGTVDTGVDAQVFDVDGVDNGADVVATLHRLGRKVICYVNAGAAEDFRPDRAAFPDAVLGNDDGWPGEHWLDIRQVAVLRPIMAARFAICRQKGFDGIEADEVAGFSNDTGFPLTARDQLVYNRMLAGLAHGLGLSIGLKNDLGQIPDLLPDFDFAIDEQCFQFHECDQLSPFIRAGKAVFHAEYNVDNAVFCPQTTRLGFSSIRKNLNLDAARWPC